MFPHMIFKSNYEFSPVTLNIIKVLFSPPFSILSLLSCPSPNDLPICYKVLSTKVRLVTQFWKKLKET